MKANNSTIAILGLGKTGISVAKYLKNKNKEFIIYDTRENLEIPVEIEKYINKKNIYLGKLNQNIIKRHDNFIVSPGIKLEKEFINEILKKNKNIKTDIDIFNEENSCKTICITGSNGKTTVTSMLEHILTGMGKKAKAGGNIGLPALELLFKDYEFCILELSSFQLEITKKIKSLTSAITNITPDHLDRHSTFENYVRIKHKIFKYSENIIINREDANIKKQNFTYKYTFGDSKPKNENELGILLENGKKYIFHGKNKILSEDEIKLIGSHNMINVCNSLCVILSLGFNINEAAKQIKSFKPIEHRMESFYNDGKISWINDSKATNVASTISAVNSLDENIILILGGKSKEEDYGKLNSVINNKVKQVIIYGASRNLLSKQINPKNKPIEVVNINDAVKMAKKISKKNMNSNSESISILLSPACSSYDMFKSYEERGLYFKKCVFEQ